MMDPLTISQHQWQATFRSWIISHWVNDWRCVVDHPLHFSIWDNMDLCPIGVLQDHTKHLSYSKG
jgi:hypothetical protein